MRQGRRRLLGLLPLALLIGLSIPALNQASTTTLPEISEGQAKAIIEHDLRRRFSTPLVTNEFVWRSFTWKGDGEVELGSAPTDVRFPAHFAQVYLVWTKTTRTREGQVLEVEVFETGAEPIETTESDVRRLPQILAFYWHAQWGWQYKFESV